MAKFQILCILIILLTFFSNVKSERFEVYTQTAFSNLMTRIANDSTRSTWTDIYIDSYDGGVYSNDYLQDLSGISILSELTSLKTITIQIGHSLYGQLGFDQTMDAIKDLTNVTNMYIFFYGARTTASKLTNIDKLDEVIKTKPGLTRLYLHFGYNRVTDFSVGLKSLPLLTNLSTELRMHFYGNQQTSVTGFKDLFHNLVNLKKFTLNLDHNQVTSVSDLEDSFHKLQNLVEFGLQFTNNPIKVFTLQNCAAQLTKVTNIYMYFGPPKNDPSAYPNFYIANDYATYHQMLLRKDSISFSNFELFKHMPKMKTLRIYSSGEGYDYAMLKHIIDCLEFAPVFENLYFEFVSMPVSDNFDYTEWYNLFDTIRTRIKYFYFYDHACYSNTGDHTHWSKILEGTTSLYRLYLRSYVGNRNIKTYGQIDHPTLTTFTFVHYSVTKTSWKFSDLATIYDGFPNLTTVHLEFSYCGLKSEDMYDFHYAYKGLTGRLLSNTFYLHLGGNQLSDLNFLQNPYSQKIEVNYYMYFNLNINKLTNLNGFKNQLESFLHPNSDHMIFYMTTNQLSDVSGLSNAFVNFKLVALYLDLRTNKIENYTQMIGVLDGQQPYMDRFMLYTSGNLITDQLPLNELLLPLTYYKKSWVNTFYFSFIDPSYGATSGHGSLRSAGKYPAIAEKGACWSTYTQAQYYYETVDPEDSEKFIKNCGNCHSNKCHSCTETTVSNSKCEKCRYSEPARVLSDDCNCPVGYYEGTSNYTCEQCMYLCISCTNGTKCTSCKVSTPARTTENCICPEQYYDDGTNIQCKNCINGCKVCDNGSTCTTCLDGYYKNSSNTCIKCPNKFKKCTSHTVGTECQGINRTSVTPNCYCSTGYYDDNTNANCVECTNNCSTCTSSSVCQSCDTGFYLNVVQCTLCPLKFVTCDSAQVGTQCQGNNRSTTLPDCDCLPGYFDASGSNLKDCSQCTSPCKTCQNSATQCYSCIDGYYLNGNTCVKCPNKFSKCTSSTVGTLCQGTNRSSVTPDCNCNSGYYDDGTNKANCTQCTNNCATCNTSTFCKSCVSSYYLNNNTCNKCPLKYAECATPTDGLQCQGTNRSSLIPHCLCNPGYYDDGTNKANCTQCINNCATCTSSTICQSCIDGYYLNGNTCVKCLLKFKTCSSSTQGTECQGTNRSTETPNCICNDGFYNDVSEINCQTCQSPCKFCSTQSLCTSCIDGYYLDGTSCIQCNYKFAKCSDSTTAVQCKGLNRTTDISNSCPCENGYYDDQSNSDCVICNSPCKYCTTGNNCTSCIDGYYLDGVQCLQCPARFETCTSETVGTKCQGDNRTLNLPNCECEDTYYDDNTNSNCQKCLYPCINCTSTKCLSCTDNIFRNQDDECSCFEGYYDHTLSKQCSLCNYKCDLCSTSHNVCDTCSDINNRDLTQNCICKPSYFDIDQQELCEKCIHPCENCTDFTVCVTCSITDDINRNSAPSCTCKDGYYDDPDTHECLKCLNKCNKCSDAFTCTECNDTAGTYRNLLLEDNCGCQDGYYDNQTNTLQCQICQYPCQYCTSESICIEGKCSSLLYRDLRSNTCECLKGYYDNGSACATCHVKCSECTNRPTMCISGQCSSDTRENYPSCTCKKGLKEIGIAKCGQCAVKCESCFKGFSNCSVCVTGKGRLSIKDNCDCKKGYYDDQENEDCQECSPLCETCSDGLSCDSCQIETSDVKNLCQPIRIDEPQYASFSVVNPISNIAEDKDCEIQCDACENTADFCTICKVGINRINQTPYCRCKDGYHDTNGTKDDCKDKCEPQCKTCNDFKTCTSCDTDNNWVMNESTKMCECINGYKEETIQNLQKQCVECKFYFQNMCVDKCPESTRVDLENGLCVEIEYIRKNNMLFMIGGGVCLVIIQIVLFGILKYSFKTFINKKIPNFLKLEQEEAQADIESEKRLKEIYALEHGNDSNSNSNSAEEKYSPNVFRDSDTFSKSISNNSEDIMTIQKNIKNQEENNQKRVSHLLSYQKKRQSKVQNFNQETQKPKQRSRSRFIQNE